MQVKFELPDSALEEWAKAFAGLDAAQFAKEAFLLEAYRRGLIGREPVEKRERLPFDQLPQRLKDSFEKDLKSLRLETGDRNLDHASIVRGALEDWYAEGEGEGVRRKAATAQRISALTGRSLEEVLLELGRGERAVTANPAHQ